MTDDRATNRNAGQPCADAAGRADTAHVAILAFCADPDTAHRWLDILKASDAPVDRITVLGRADASGDDETERHPPALWELPFAGVADAVRKQP
jgi:hypothetical protein